MLQRRSNLYAFSSLNSVKKYFQQFFSAEAIENEVETAREGFITRRGSSEKETQLQFVKKCEFRLLRKVRELNTQENLYA